MPRGSFSDTQKSAPVSQDYTRADKYMIGLVAFNKHIAEEMARALGAGVIDVEPTDEQRAIWDTLMNRTEHVIAEAVAGSGKTFTITQYAAREKARGAHVECMTYHSLGFRALRNARLGACEVDAYKVLGMVDSIGGVPSWIPKRDQKAVKYRVKELVGFAKSMGYRPDETTREDLETIADRHDLDVDNYSPAIYELVPKVLQACIDNLATVDFDDQIWVPMVLNLPVPRYDVLCVDEYQDTGLTQQWLAIKAARRLCAVGDPRQAIYQFRGADSKGFDRLRQKLGSQVLTLPLTLTRRCPQSHVRLAQGIVPQIHAMEHAPEGEIRVMAKDDAVACMKPGDLVMCRVNAELVSTGYKLIKRGVRALIRGKNFGDGMTRLVEKAEADVLKDELNITVRAIITYAGELTNEAVQKFNAIPDGRGEQRALNAQERYDCLCVLAQNAKTVNELKDTIVRMFDDKAAVKDCVVLGTVHRTKGLEANRVFILRPDLIPHPMARGEEGRESERNLGYVAVTRAKFRDAVYEEDSLPGELVFIDCECPMFPLNLESTEEEQEQPYMDPDERKWAEEMMREAAPGPEEIGVAPDEHEPDPIDDDLDAFNEAFAEFEADRGEIPEHRRWKN